MTVSISWAKEEFIVLFKRKGVCVCVNLINLYKHRWLLFSINKNSSKRSAKTMDSMAVGFGNLLYK